MNPPDQPAIPEPTPPPGGNPFEWFDLAICGVFFHWGPYSVAARSEWVMNRECIPPDEYHRLYVEPWQAGRFDPDAWMETALSLGATYVVFTARHHDGFALWNSRVNANNSVNSGPRRDLVGEVCAAARRAGLRVGLYYSAANWIHPDYPSAFARDWPLDTDWQSGEHRARFQDYVSAELRELCTGYGRIDYLWYDGCLPANICTPAWNALVRELQPAILINSRSGPADVHICEQALHDTPPQGRWEACFTLNRNWGYHAGDCNYKSPLDLLELLLKVHGGHGKLLLNVGPAADGSIPPETTRILRLCGDWIRTHREILVGTGASTFSWNNTTLISTQGHKVFLHFLPDIPNEFCWAETQTVITAAVDYLSRRTIRMTRDGARIHLHDLRATVTPGVLSTVELSFAQPPEPLVPRTTFWIPD